MMTVMAKAAGKALADRKDSRPGEDNMPELLRHSSRTAPKGYVKTTPRPKGRGAVQLVKEPLLTGNKSRDSS